MTTTPFNVLPPSFSYQQRVRSSFYSWLSIVGTLAVILVAVILASLLRRSEIKQRNEQIVASALPLISLRQDVQRLETFNEQCEQACRAVETAQPDDSLLQTIAAIAVVSESAQPGILVDSVQLRLPIEYPESPTAPSWAEPILAISARVINAEAASSWGDQLNELDRIANAVVESDSAVAGPTGLTQIHVKATPLATRVLP
jgi:hypothetical protein